VVAATEDVALAGAALVVELELVLPHAASVTANAAIANSHANDRPHQHADALERCLSISPPTP
jgi:hypothetical protein